MAGELVSRILCGAALASLLRDDHSSSPGLATGIERPTRGFILARSLRRTQGSPFFRTRSASWASSALLFGLAPRGVCRAGIIADTAVGSYPTFSPLPALRSIERHPEGFPPGYHRETLRRRYVLCGTFRNAIPVNHVPWRYQARCPILLLRLAAEAAHRIHRWCPDFPPAQALARPGQRSSSSPASSIIPRMLNVSLCFMTTGSRSSLHVR